MYTRLFVSRQKGIGLLLAAALVAWQPSGPSAGADAGRTAGFSIAFEDDESAYRETSVFLLPKAALQIRIVTGPSGEYSIKADDGQLTRRGLRSWQWDAPATPGLFDLEVKGPSGTDTITLRAFVLVPAAARTATSMVTERDVPDPPRAATRSGSPSLRRSDEGQSDLASPSFPFAVPVQAGAGGALSKCVVLEERLILDLEHSGGAQRGASTRIPCT